MGPTGLTVTGRATDITATVRVTTRLRITAIMDGRITDPDMDPMPIMAGRIIGTATGGTGSRKARSIAPGFLLRGIEAATKHQH
jgi:hypothetical protein